MDPLITNSNQIERVMDMRILFKIASKTIKYHKKVNKNM